MISPEVEIPPHIAETVQAIALLHPEHHRKSTLAERVIDHITAVVGRPIFLWGLAIAVALWMGVNIAVEVRGGRPVDPPPFTWLDLILTMSALFIAVLILTIQRRADRFANLREQMTLEATLLTEQKTRKIIELLEELRRDSPEIQDRQDEEAEQIAIKADPHTVLGVIEVTTDEAIKNVNDSAEAHEG